MRPVQARSGSRSLRAPIMRQLLIPTIGASNRFKLEALEAKAGDSLLLHLGTDEKPILVLIDGGPGGVYSGSLRPRLEELRKARAPGNSLLIDMVMVSHIDDDHINGILQLAREMVR